MTTMRKSTIIMAWAACLAGCAQYVNIPPQKGDMAYHDPNSKHCRQVMLAALQRVVELRPINESFQIMLPVGTVPATYGLILPQVSEQAMWSSDGRTKDIPVVAVTQVRIRGRRAEVDVARPAYSGEAPGVAQITTAYLQYQALAKTSNWYVTRVREWRHNGAQRAQVDE